MSTVIAKNVQVGADGTASNNFTVYQPATPDGTLRIGNGNSGTTSNLVTVTSAGNVGVGTSSPSNAFELRGDAKRLVAQNSTNSGEVEIEAQVYNYWGGTGGPTYTGAALIQNGAGTAGTTAGVSNANLGMLRFQNSSGGLIYTNGGVPIVFATSSTERARIDSSGVLLVGTTSDPVGTRIYSYSSDLAARSTMVCATGSTNNGYYIDFRNSAGANSGRIEKNGTTTVAYTTTSDYRLKENVAPMVGALEKVAQLKPVTYTWKDDGKSGQGFIAHELQAVVPDCVTGEKDAVETYTDNAGNEQTRPKYQGIDTSFLVATLTAAIQEQQALITTLTARIEALEAK